VYPQ
jgi:hypothetical protein